MKYLIDMKLVRILSVLLCMIIMIMSCNTNCKHTHTDENSALTTIVLDEKQLDNPKCISTTRNKYFKSCRYVQLETDTNMLIGRIDKVLLNEDRIYIMDRFVTKNVFVFDKDGRFINKISRLGQGPEEYIDINDIFYDESEQTINIQSWGGIKGQFKIMSFDRDGKELLKQTPIDLRFWLIDRMKDGRYVFHTKNSTNFPDIISSIFVYSSTMQKVYDDLPIPVALRDKGMSVSGGRLFKGKEGDMYCSKEYETDIYQIGKDSLIKLYHYNVGKYTYPDEFKSWEKSRQLAESSQMSNYIVDIIDFYENDKYAVSLFLYKGGEKIVFYDKNTRETQVYFLLNNPLYLDGFGSFEGITNGCLVSSRPAEVYTSVFNDPTIMGEEATNDLKRRFKRPINEDDNPILFIYEFAD